MSTTTDATRTDRTALLDALRDAGADVSKPGTICCPFHDDKHASAGVYKRDGVWRFKCQTCDAGGDVFDIRARTQGKPVADVLRDGAHTHTAHAPKRQSRTYPTIDAMRNAVAHCIDAHAYTNPDTQKVEMVVLRIQPPDEGKRFLQARPCADGFELKAPAQPWPLYNRTRVRDAEKVVVVEGEKCVHALKQIGVVATTSPGGAGKACHADWWPLAGKTVYLWPDCDPPNGKGQRTGIAHMRDVRKCLDALNPPARLFSIDPDGLELPPKGDVVDYLAKYAGGGPEAQRTAVGAVMDLAEPMGASNEVGALIEDTISGRRRAIDWPWTGLSRLTKSLLPGTVTLLCGSAGSTKSFMLLESMMHWHTARERCCVFELEEDRKYHLHRALAQRAGMSCLFDDAWVRDNPDAGRGQYETHREFLDAFGPCIHDAPDHQITLTALGDWIEQRAMDGNRIIAVDPVTAAATSDRPWIDDSKFLMRVKTVARQFDTSVILVTHPKKGHQAHSLDDLAGGAAFARFSQTVLWIEQHVPPVEVTVMTSFGKLLNQVNRSIVIGKARNASGGGLKLGFDFDGATLRLSECGVIVKT